MIRGAEIEIQQFFFRVTTGAIIHPIRPLGDAELRFRIVRVFNGKIELVIVDVFLSLGSVQVFFQAGHIGVQIFVKAVENVIDRMFPVGVFDFLVDRRRGEYVRDLRRYRKTVLGVGLSGRGGGRVVVGELAVLEVV